METLYLDGVATPRLPVYLPGWVSPAAMASLALVFSPHCFEDPMNGDMQVQVLFPCAISSEEALSEMLCVSTLDAGVTVSEGVTEGV